MLSCGLLLLSWLTPSTGIEGQTNCETPEFQTPCAAFNQTSTALAATYGITSTPAPQTPLPLGTQTALPLLSEPTAVINNPTCPGETFDTDELDPVWRLSCSHCLPEEAESGNPMDVWLREQSTAVSGVEFSTLPPLEFEPGGTAIPTLDATQTVMPSLTPTATSTYAAGGTYQVAIIDFDARWDMPIYTEMRPGAGGSSIGAGYTGSGLVQEGYYNSSGGLYGNEMEWSIQVNPSWHIVGLVFRYRWSAVGSQSGFVGWLADQQQARTDPNGLANLLAKTTNWTTKEFWWTGSGITGYSYLGYYNIYASPTKTLFYVDDITVVYTGVPFTATPTATATMMPTGTAAPTSTPTTSWLGVSVLPPANCSVPRYSEPTTPIMDMEIGNLQEGQCFVLLPPIDHPAGIDLEIAEHQVCLYPFALNIQILGMTIDMAVLLAAPAFFFVMRWMLRN